MARDQCGGDWEGCDKFGKAHKGWTMRTMKNMNLGIYSSCHIRPINGFQEDCDTVISIL